MYKLIGEVSTGRGLTAKRSADGAVADSYVLGSNGYRQRQPVDIPLCIEHDTSWQVGTVTYLERSSAGVMLVAELDDAAAEHMSNFNEGDWYLSSGVDALRFGRSAEGFREYVDATITEVSLTTSPAGIGNRPARWWPSDSGGGGRLPLSWYATVARADGARRASGFLEIVDVPEPVTKPPAPKPVALPARRAAPERRAAAPEQVYRHTYAAPGWRMFRTPGR